MDGKKVRFIILEYIPGVPLNKYEIPSILLWSIIYQLLLGLKFIHDQGCAHSDISLDNIMITNGIVKYIDFGLSCVNRCPQDIKSCNICEEDSY